MKRTIKLLLLAVAIVAVLCSGAAFADVTAKKTTGVKYRENGVEKTTPDGTDVYIIDVTFDPTEPDNMNKDWYVVQGQPKFADSFEFTNSSGVNIILEDGAVLDISASGGETGGSVLSSSSSSLTIYAQSSNRDKMGLISADFSGYELRGSEFVQTIESKGDLTIHGGIVKARANSYPSNLNTGTYGFALSCHADIIIGADAVVEASAFGKGFVHTINAIDFVSSGDVTTTASGSGSLAALLVRENLKIVGGVLHATAKDGDSRANGIWVDKTTSVFSIEGGWVESTPQSQVNGTMEHTGGALIDGDTGTVKGTAIIPAGMTATLRDGVELTIPAGATLTVEQGATLDNKGTIKNNGMIDSKGTVSGNQIDNNGAYFHDGGGEVSGDITLTENRTITGTLTVKDGASFTVGDGVKLTVEDGAQLTVEDGATLDASKGTLVNDGNVKLPANTDISGLGMTGSGKVEMDGKTYDNTGKDTTPTPTPGQTPGSTPGQTPGTTPSPGTSPTPTPTPEQEGAAQKVLASFGFVDTPMAVIEGAIDRTTSVTIDGRSVVAQMTISQDVTHGSCVEINGSTLDAVRHTENVRFHKIFTDTAGTAMWVHDFDDKYAKLIVIDDTAHVEFDAVIVIIDDTAPTPSPTGFVPGAIPGQGLIEQTQDGVNVIVIWDGERDGYACDPIVATDGAMQGSSSGACASGVAVIVAIAALAMMKRRQR